MKESVRAGPVRHGIDTPKVLCDQVVWVRPLLHEPDYIQRMHIMHNASYTKFG